MNDPFQQQRLENVSAVSAVLHGDEKYKQFYDENADALSGFPGIWRMCAFAGDAFTQVEIELGETWEGGSWIQAIDDFVALIMTESSPDPVEFPARNTECGKQNWNWLHKLAKQAIEKNRD